MFPALFGNKSPATGARQEDRSRRFALGEVRPGLRFAHPGKKAIQFMAIQSLALEQIHPRRVLAHHPLRLAIWGDATTLETRAAFVWAAQRSLPGEGIRGPTRGKQTFARSLLTEHRHCQQGPLGRRAIGTRATDWAGKRRAGKRYLNAARGGHGPVDPFGWGRGEDRHQDRSMLGASRPESAICDIRSEAFQAPPSSSARLESQDQAKNR